MAAERDLGCLDGLLLAPVDRTAIYFGKALSNWLFILLTAVIFLPLFGLLYNAFSVLRPGMLGIVLMGTFGYAAVGTLFSTMTIQTRTREILLPVLLLPVVLPLLFAAVRAGAGILQGSSWQDILPWFNLLLAYDLVLPAACFMAFEYVVEE
jgi:heme exporter protein B